MSETPEEIPPSSTSLLCSASRFAYHTQEPHPAALATVLKYHRMNISPFLLLSVAPAVLLGADRMAVGLTRTKKVIEASAVPGASRNIPTVLLIGGLDGHENS